MAKTDTAHFRDFEMTKLSGPVLKSQIATVLANSSQCQAIFECVNQDTGEYRLVLHGVLEGPSDN